MAYILEHKEFWGLKLTVTPEVLVPRPETEHLVEWILANFPASPSLQLADLGTGLGAIALALALERPVWQVDATDYSLPALTLAKQNAEQHQLANIQFFLGHWCAALPARRYSLLVSNPPYIAEDDPHLQNLSHEPLQALASGADGLNAIREIVSAPPIIWFHRAAWYWNMAMIRPPPLINCSGNRALRTCKATSIWRVNPGFSPPAVRAGMQSILEIGDQRTLK